jgi:hypothetical protein
MVAVSSLYDRGSLLGLNSPPLANEWVHEEPGMESLGHLCEIRGKYKNKYVRHLGEKEAEKTRRTSVLI